MLPAILGAVGSIAGGLLSNKANKKAAAENVKTQKEFAQNSLQWKAADAEKAGISKVFAMGAPTTSFAPSNVGSNFDFLGDAGQNIGRAITAQSSPGGAAAALPKAAAAVQLEGMQLDNEFKRAQIASLQKNYTQAGTPPPGPEYTVDGPTLKLQTNRDLSTTGQPYTVPGAGPDITMTHTAGGGYTWDTPPQLAESRESDFFVKNAANFWRNGVLPAVNPHTRVPQQVINSLPPGTTPVFDPFTQEWYASRHRGRHLAIPYGFQQRR